MKAIEVINNIVFVQKERDAYFETWLAEHSGCNYRIKMDKTMPPPYYELFLDYTEGGRPWSTKLFATSSEEKILEWITANIN